MKLNEIEVGMKVVPVKKSFNNNYASWLSSSISTSKFFKENGFLYVIRIEPLYGLVVLGTNPKMFFGGDHFAPQDIVPYDPYVPCSETVEKINQQVENLAQVIFGEAIPLNMLTDLWNQKDGTEQLQTQPHKKAKSQNQIEKITVVRNGKATVVILEDGVKGVSKCCPEDEYDENFGFQLAYQRAKEKQARRKQREKQTA